MSTSRSFVGSSRSNRFPPERRSFARCTRFRSPPERSLTSFCWSPPRKLNHETYCRELTSRFPSSIVSWFPEISFQTVFRALQRGARLVDVRELDRVAELERPGIGLLLAGDHAEERRLARTVRADHAHDPSGWEVERQVLDEEPVAEALLHPVGADDDVAEAGARGDVDLDTASSLVA